LAREITEMNLNTIEFDDIFRTTRLISKVPSEKLNGQRTEVIKTQSLPTASVTTQAVLTPATSTASMSPPASSWAKITKSVTPPPQLTMPLPPKQQDKNTVRNKTPVQPAWSPGPRGLDPPITVTVQAMENIKRRAGNDKLCNNHFLRGPCTRMDICPFVHNYKLSQEDIRALAMLSRQNPCTSGQDCDVEDCIYGHHVSRLPNTVCFVADLTCHSAPMLPMECALDNIAGSPRRLIRQIPSLPTRTSMTTSKMKFRLVF
jgi:hypothetical protein